MGPAGGHPVAFARAEPHFFLRLLHEQAKLPRQNVECIADMAVAMPGHGLRRRELQLADPEPGALQVIGPMLHLE